MLLAMTRHDKNEFPTKEKLSSKLVESAENLENMQGKKIVSKNFFPLIIVIGVVVYIIYAFLIHENDSGKKKSSLIALRETKTEIYDNGKYTGDFVNGLREGYGVYNWKSGNRYSGDWKAGLEHGQGTYLYKNGDKYEGGFIKGEMDGKGIYTHYGGEKYEGDYLKGKRHGKGIYMFSNGEIYKGDFINDERSGKGVLTMPNGNRYEGDFVDGKVTGYGIMYYDNGIYEGFFVNSARHGVGVYRFFDSGIKVIGTFKNNKKHGYIKQLDKYGGIIEEGMYQNGIKK